MPKYSTALLHTIEPGLLSTFLDYVINLDPLLWSYLGKIPLTIVVEDERFLTANKSKGNSIQ